MRMARREAFGIQVAQLDRLFEHLLLVGHVEDREVVRQSHHLSEVLQNPQAQRMERADRRAVLDELPEVAPSSGRRRCHPRSHFARSLVGKGDGENAVRRNALIYQPRDASSDHAGLA